MKKEELGTVAVASKMPFKAMMVSVGMSYIVSIILFLVFAIFASIWSFSDLSMRGGVLAITVIGVIVAGFLTGRAAKCKGLIYGAIVGVIYILILYIISALAFNGPMFSVSFFTMILIGISGGAFGGIVGINKGEHKRR